MARPAEREAFLSGSSLPEGLELESRAVGALPIINHFAEMLGLFQLLHEHVPGNDARSQWPPAVGLGVILRNLLVSREPLYALKEWSSRCMEPLLGLPVGSSDSLNDDRLGRCLDKLFEADRAALMTAVVVQSVKKLDLRMDELHNDTTTVTFQGEYRGANGQRKNGRPTQRITYGHNKDHRPDLKQLIYNLTTTADGATPVWCNVTHGNTSDDQSHIGTWNALRELVGGPDFLYVADSKLCTRENMNHINSNHGRFVTVLPRSRSEVDSFREWMGQNSPDWVELLRQPNSRLSQGPDEVYRGFESPVPTGEGSRILWVWSSQKAERDQLSRKARMTRADQMLAALATRLHSPRSRITRVEQAQEVAQAILASTHTEALIDVSVETEEEETFKQTGPGRPSPNTRYTRMTREKLTLHWSTQSDALKADARMDGIFPLVTNDHHLSAQAVLMAYKHQPSLERRYEQMKSVLQVMPVFLKSPSRIEALLFLYFLALLLQALIERRVRSQMAEKHIPDVPLYPEERDCEQPTANKIFRLFGDVRCHRLIGPGGTVLRAFYDRLTPHQTTLLQLLGMHPSKYFADLQQPAGLMP